VTLDFWEFVTICQQAGRIPTPVDVDSPHASAQPGTEALPERALRPCLGEAPSLRQQGPTAEARKEAG